ncbi:beta-1,3-glucanase family protein [Streptomyces sp. SBT349]|uniref:beta-1,3-glucanase family protein n=1 Tax=Streptomyces sp. SBT349 TaxID=1580539 RepID=UPI00066E7F5F|nr:beta-1,3-glucanase family protein [Streptomyces sp. SBT349]
MVTRRSLLRGAAVAGTAAAVPLLAGRATGTSADPAAPRDAAPLPLTVANRTGRFGNESVWLYIVGNDGQRQVRVTADGQLLPVAVSDNGPDGYTDYAIPMGSGDTTIPLPHMSGRIYVALGDKLSFRAVQDGNGNAALAYPAGWVESDPNYPVLHDCAEFTYNPQGMYCNTTMVDMFSVPLSIHLRGARDQTVGTLRDGARERIFSALAADDTFAPLVLDDLRVLAPGHGLDAGLFPGDYFDPYVDRVWDTFAGSDLVITTNAGAFTGRVSGDQLVFTGPGTVSFARPPTRDVLFCDGALRAPNDGMLGPVAAVLAAALNRTTALSHPGQPTTDPAQFYREEPAHHYSRIMHEESVDGRAYGFAFDDVASFASYIEDGAPTAFTLTLTPF